ncbi:MAG: WXG100 family type VII secretion target [Oscillochloris sp.]|nr:WXG100 family type VII secretion target [Oscillochloris sp.]
MSVVPTGYAGSVVRADTDQLRAVARQMRATADQIMGGHDGMQQSMAALDATWSGHARDRGMARWAEIAPKYRPSTEGLVHLANGLESLAQRLDDAAAVFGAGGSSEPTTINSTIQDAIDAIVDTLQATQDTVAPIIDLDLLDHLLNFGAGVLNIADYFKLIEENPIVGPLADFASVLLHVSEDGSISTQDLIAAGLTTGMNEAISLIPGGAEVMLANAIVQIAGPALVFGTTGLLQSFVSPEADARLEAIEQQMYAGLDKMDLTNITESFGTALADGDFSDVPDALLGSVGDVGIGTVEVLAGIGEQTVIAVTELSDGVADFSTDLADDLVNGIDQAASTVGSWLNPFD